MWRCIKTAIEVKHFSVQSTHTLFKPYEHRSLAREFNSPQISARIRFCVNQKTKEWRNERRWEWNKWTAQIGTKIRTKTPFYKREKLCHGPFSGRPSPQTLTLIPIPTTSSLPQAMAPLPPTPFPIVS